MSIHNKGAIPSQHKEHLPRPWSTRGSTQFYTYLHIFGTIYIGVIIGGGINRHYYIYIYNHKL